MLQRSKLATAGVAIALSAALGVLPAAAANAAQPAAASSVSQAVAAPAAVPVTGTAVTGDSFVGQISDLTVRTVNGALQLTGSITGNLTNTAGVVTPVTDTFTATIADLAVGDACDILNLDLGPLHLNVLGLVIDLQEVVLDITAVPGAGNLLGNLLCAVAGLLDGNGPLQGIGALLNRLLTGLGL